MPHKDPEARRAYERQYGLTKWSQYEKPIDKVVACCEIMKTGKPVKKVA